MPYPILAASDTWFTQGGTAVTRASITKIRIVDSYTATGDEAASWDASAAGDGSVMAYVTGTELTIAGNGSGKIMMNSDSSYAFSSASSDRFGNVTAMEGAELLDSSSATTFYRLFYVCGKLTGVNVGNWNTQNVKNMNGVFNQCFALKTAAVENWDTSACTDMTGMFQLATALTSLNLSKWNVGKVTSMRSMFMGHASYGEMALVSIGDVSGWNVGAVTTMQGMFQLCPALTALNVSGWDVGNVTNMQSMFYGCTSLTALDVSGWDVGNVTTMQGMFQLCVSLTTLDVSDWDVSKVTTFGGMFCGYDYGATPVPIAELDVSKWDTSSCTDMSSMFYGCKGPKVIDVSNWDVSKVTNFDHMFAHSYLSIGDVGRWTTPAAINMNAMFYSVQNTTLDVSGLITKNVTVFDQMFERCDKLISIAGLEGFDTSAGLGFSEMFRGCSSLPELDLSSFDTTRAKDGASASTNGSLTTAMSGMFLEMHALRKVTLGEKFSFNGDGTTTTNIAALPAPSSDYIDGATGKWYRTSDWKEFAPADVPSCEAAAYAAIRPAFFAVRFSTMRGIGDAIREKTGGTDGVKPGEMAGLIRGINAGGGDTLTMLLNGTLTEYSSNLESIINYAFAGSPGLTAVNTPKLTSIPRYAFAYCTALTAVYAPQATSVGLYAFRDSALEEADFPNVVEIGDGAFYGSSSPRSKLAKVNIPKATTIEANAFWNCANLREVNAPLVQELGGAAFGAGSAGLGAKFTTLDFHSLASIGMSAFSRSNLCCLVLRNETVATLQNTSAFDSTPVKIGTGYIYVPAALVDTYKAATNWSTFADQFRALESFTVDGTVTGELDDEKIAAADAASQEGTA